jgi:O-acetylserine/cysteine efflux transporter
LSLYYGQEHGVPAPIASLTTALLPLFVMTLAATFLGEVPSARRILGFAVAAGGMVVVALVKREEARVPYAMLIAVTALAPLSWSLYSVLSTPVARRVRPLLWTYLSVTAGTVMVLPLLPGALGSWTRLDLPGWGALLYLSFPCTVLGFAVWTWLLRHLPASSVGFTVFLNPPLTAMSKLALAALFPATFLFAVKGQEILGGALALLGLLIAVVDARRPGSGAGGLRRPPATAPGAPPR